MIGVIELEHRLEIEVRLSYPDFRSVCPLTGQTDYAKILVDYSPRELLIESQSFEEYLKGFRDKPLLIEKLVDQVLHDVREAAQPHWIKVYYAENEDIGPHDALSMGVTAEYYRNEQARLS